MTAAEKDSPAKSFWQREGDALLRVGVLGMVQILLVLGVLYFTGNRSASDDAATLRSGIHPASSQGAK